MDMGFRVLMVLAMGLGAMYMLHLLAQDWDRIRRPVTKALARALFRSKREIPSDATNKPHDGFRLEMMQMQNESVIIDWNRIMSRDPLECLQSLLCQIAAGAESNSQEAILLMNFVQATLSTAPEQIQKAVNFGLSHAAAFESCFGKYPYCFYSARNMLIILKWFNRNKYVTGAENFL